VTKSRCRTCWFHPRVSSGSQQCVSFAPHFFFPIRFFPAPGPVHLTDRPDSVCLDPSVRRTTTCLRARLPAGPPVCRNNAFPLDRGAPERPRGSRMGGHLRPGAPRIPLVTVSEIKIPISTCTADHCRPPVRDHAAWIGPPADKIGSRFADLCTPDVLVHARTGTRASAAHPRARLSAAALARDPWPPRGG